MAITHTLYKKEKIVFSTLSGIITDSLLLESYAALYTSKDWLPGLDEVVDLSHADMTAVSADGMQRLAALTMSHTKSKCESFRTALIAPDDLIFGLSRLYEGVSEESPEQVMVFRNLSQACDWIGVDIATIQID